MSKHKIPAKNILVGMLFAALFGFLTIIYFGPMQYSTQIGLAIGTSVFLVTYAFSVCGKK